MSNKNEYVINVIENKTAINLEIRKPDLRYLNEFVRLKCSADLLTLKLFPNAKEITESFAVYNTVRTYLQREFPFNDTSVRCFVVGDGCSPRTGALFAFRTNWDVISIDPQLYKTKYLERTLFEVKGVNRLTGFSGRIEELDLDKINYSGSEKTLIVNVHSHAKISSCLKKLATKTRTVSVISMPCCVPDDISTPDISYLDYGIHSQKRRINIYKKDLT